MLDEYIRNEGVFRMRILWCGDGGCKTGFARVTHEICNRLVMNGHTVDVLGINYRGEPNDGYDDPLYNLWVPTKFNSGDVYGLGRMAEIVGRTRPDVIVFLNDIPIIERILEV